MDQSKQPLNENLKDISNEESNQVNQGEHSPYIFSAPVEQQDTSERVVRIDPETQEIDEIVEEVEDIVPGDVSGNRLSEPVQRVSGLKIRRRVLRMFKKVDENWVYTDKRNSVRNLGIICLTMLVLSFGIFSFFGINIRITTTGEFDGIEVRDSFYFLIVIMSLELVVVILCIFLQKETRVTFDKENQKMIIKSEKKMFCKFEMKEIEFGQVFDFVIYRSSVVCYLKAERHGEVGQEFLISRFFVKDMAMEVCRRFKAILLESMN